MKPVTLAPLLFSAAGLLLLLLPTRWLVTHDSKTGSAIYERTLAETGDERKALRNANVFYKLFGLAFVVFGISIELFIALAD